MFRFALTLANSLVLLAASLTPTAHAEIYKCSDEEGNVSYQQMPCPAAKDDDPQPVEPVRDDYVPESTLSPESFAARDPSSRQPGESLADCKKRYRDQIDEIDAEMRRAFSPEQGVAYKENLLVLTKQLRACSTAPSDTG